MSRTARRWLRYTAFATLVLLALQYLLAGSSLGLGWRPRRVLILTAHPDDETMFFAPAIISLVAMGASVSGLCLSNGDAAGLGRIREVELTSAYATLGVPFEAVNVIDDPVLPDGMHLDWPQDRVVGYVRDHLLAHGPFDTLLTFDKHGVTYHANHVACYRAAKQIILAGKDDPSDRLLHGFALRTLPVTTKFAGAPGALIRHHLFRSNSEEITPPIRISFLSSPMDYLRALQAMARHRSQLVWFRYLYVLFSGYMYNVQFEAII